MGVVVSVEAISIAVGSGDLSASQSLTLGQDITQCVVYSSYAIPGALNQQLERASFRVRALSGPDRIEIDRAETGNAITFDGFVVEYDTAAVSVQQVAVTIAASSTAGTAAISSVDLTKTWAIGYGKFGTGSPLAHWSNAVETTLPSAVQVQLDRSIAQSYTWVGNVFVCEGLASSITVDTATLQMLATENLDTLNIPGIDHTRAFCVTSYRYSLADDDSDNGTINAWLADGGAGSVDVSIERYDGTGQIDATVFVVEIDDADMLVQRGTFDLPSSTPSETAAISAVTLSRSSVHTTIYSGLGNGGRVNSTAFFRIDNTFLKMAYNSTIEVEGSRLEGSSAGVFSWESISWPIAGSGPAVSGAEASQWGVF